MQSNFRSYNHAQGRYPQFNCRNSYSQRSNIPEYQQRCTSYQDHISSFRGQDLQSSICRHEFMYQNNESDLPKIYHRAFQREQNGEPIFQEGQQGRRHVISTSMQQLYKNKKIKNQIQQNLDEWTMEDIQSRQQPIQMRQQQPSQNSDLQELQQAWVSTNSNNLDDEENTEMEMQDQMFNLFIHETDRTTNRQQQREEMPIFRRMLHREMVNLDQQNNRESLMSLSRIAEILQQQKCRGLTPRQQKMLKTIKIGKSTSECTICLQKFERGERIIKLPCKHLFHKKCLLPWFKDHIKCPNCRLDLQSHFEQLRLEKLKKKKKTRVLLVKKKVKNPSLKKSKQSEAQKSPEQQEEVKEDS